VDGNTSYQDAGLSSAVAEIDLSETEGDDTIKLITDFLQELKSFLTASELEKGGSDNYAADKNRNGGLAHVPRALVDIVHAAASNDSGLT